MPIDLGMRIINKVLLGAALLSASFSLWPVAAGAAPSTITLAPGESVADALRAVAPGGTVLLTAGAHRPATVGPIVWSAPVTLKPAPGAEGQVSLGELNLRGLENFTIEGVQTRGLVTIDGGRAVTVQSSQPLGVQIKNGANEIDIRDNTIVGGWNGVTVQSWVGTPRPHHVRISGNRISGQENDNVQIGVAHDVVVENNVLADTLDNTHHNDGVQMMGGARLTVRGNRISGGHDQGILLKPEVSLGSDSAITDARIENNLIYGSREFGVILLNSTRTTLTRNTIFDNPKYSVLFSGNNTGAAVTENVVDHLYVERTATKVANQRNNCLVSGAAKGDIKVIDPLFLNRVDYVLAPLSPCAGRGMLSVPALSLL